MYDAWLSYEGDVAERMELLRHRCFATCGNPSDDRWPYDLVLVEPA